MIWMIWTCSNLRPWRSFAGAGVFGMAVWLLCGVASIGGSAAVPDDKAAKDNVTGWKASAAAIEITPAEPMWMAGYASRTKPAEGKAQSLFAKALALEDASGTRLVIITLDLISVPRPIRDRLEQALHEKFGLPPEALLLNCSHTHCGPELRSSPAALAGLEPERARQAEAYVRVLEEKLVALTGQALESLAPARLSYCHSRCGFAMNRRLPTEQGFTNSPNPEGPVDHDVPVLRVEGADGKVRAILFGYACHNTTLAFQQFCGDYAGYAQEYLERTYPGVTAMFLMGCGGDQNPYPRGTLELAQQHGLTLATAVRAALEARSRPLHGPLGRAYALATIDYATPLPSKEQLIEQKTSGKDEYLRRQAEKLLQRLESDGKLPESYAGPVQVIRFGDDLTLVALPGETVVDYSIRVKRELGGHGPAVWVAGYSNDVFAYVPSVRVLKEGGYEAVDAMKYMTIPHSNRFAETIEERIIGKVHELDKRLRPAGTP